MKHLYKLFFEPDRKHPKRAVKELVARFPGLELDDMGDVIISENGAVVRKLRNEARDKGFQAEMVVSTELNREDALLGELGLLSPGGADGFRAKLPADAFDCSKGCRQCGLGSVQVKPYLLGIAGIKCKGPFYVPDQSFRVIMRAEIGKEMAAVTGQPKCIRHLVTRDGDIIEEWVEPVPAATMPPLSLKSTGIVFKKMPCATCGRAPWAESDDTPARLVYSKAAIKAAQKHAVVEMYEPYVTVPEFSPATKSFKNTHGMPLLLFNQAAVKVLMKYIEPEKGFPSNSSISPVYSE